MQIFGLYGKSGTGKSYRSGEIVRRFRIDAVLDDGLLIVNRKRVAGKSAKNEKSAYAATKTAILFYEQHRREIADFIKHARIHKLLIIGTSQRMIELIVHRLELETSIEWVPIESLQTGVEMQLAAELRRSGYHVIPIRPVDVGKTFYGWFSRQTIGHGSLNEEVTVVRPSYMRNKIMVHPQCVKDIVGIVSDPAIRVHTVESEWVYVTIEVSMKQGSTIENLREWQRKVTSVLRYCLEITFIVTIEWRSVIAAQ